MSGGDPLLRIVWLHGEFRTFGENCFLLRGGRVAETWGLSLPVDMRGASPFWRRNLVLRLGVLTCVSNGISSWRGIFFLAPDPFIPHLRLATLGRLGVHMPRFLPSHTLCLDPYVPQDMRCMTSGEFWALPRFEAFLWFPPEELFLRPRAFRAARRTRVKSPFKIPPPLPQPRVERVVIFNYLKDRVSFPFLDQRGIRLTAPISLHLPFL